MALNWKKVDGVAWLFLGASLFLDFFVHVILGVGTGSCWIGAFSIPVIGHWVCTLIAALPLAAIGIMWYLGATLVLDKEVSKHAWEFKIVALAELLPALSILPIYSLWVTYIIAIKLGFLKDFSFSKSAGKV